MMLIVALLIVAGSIVFIVNVKRTDYKPKPIQYVSTTDYSSSQFWCPIHESYFGHMGVDCPSCNRDYHNDMYAGVYPPGIDESNKRFYYVEDWIALRKIDLLWQKGEITEQEAICRRDAYIRDTIPKRIAVATGTDPEIQKAKMEANQKRLSNYAGATQYSGIIR